MNGSLKAAERYLTAVKTITLKISNRGVHYSASGLLPWSATNLPAGTFRFSERAEIYWEVEMSGYDANEARLRVQVVDYEADEVNFAPEREMKRPVGELHFAALDGEAFKAQLSYYKAGALSGVLRENPAPEKTSPVPAPAPLSSDQHSENSNQVARPVEFSYPILDLTFANGGVKGKADLPGLADKLDFKIINDNIVAEFDAIKPFFVRALKRKTISVKTRLCFVDGEPRLDVATSPQVAKINDDMLELFRARAVKSLLNFDPVRTVDKSLFTPEDVFDSLDDDTLGKATLPHDGHDLLAEILRHRPVRNARQLEFLAGRLHETDAKLRYVLSPDFGFVFMVAGQDARHFILELLDSHATYVWSIPKDWQTLDDQYRAVEREIAAIGTVGRSQYRRTLHFDHEFWFVVHESAESGLVDGFPRWRNRLLEGLI